MDWHKEFPQKDDLIYLNHAAVGPWPLRTQKAVSLFAQENVELGATHYPEWLKTEQQLRERLRRLINVSSTNDIAFAQNTSEALSLIAYGIHWQPGDNIVISNHEFPSNRIVWESLVQFGVTVKIANLDTAESPETSIINTIDQQTRLVSISSVQYASGLRIDCKQIGEACKQHNVLFCIDAIQSIGAVTFDASAYQADFVVADGHKWMLGPEGLALFYSRPEAREQLKVNQYGWHMVKHRGDYDRDDWQMADNAQRFECGSPNMLGTYALNASLSLLEEIGMSTVETTLQSKMDYLTEGLLAIPSINILSATEQSRRAGIVTFKDSSKDSKQLHIELQSQGVICAYRGGGIRFTPHFYTPIEKIDRALSLLKHI